MRLFVIDKKCNQKIYLNTTADTRAELALLVGSRHFVLKGKDGRYDVSEVHAEPPDSYAGDPRSFTIIICAAVLGFLGGLVAGFIGFILGGIIGGVVGLKAYNRELQRINKFEQSK